MTVTIRFKTILRIEWQTVSLAKVRRCDLICNRQDIMSLEKLEDVLEILDLDDVNHLHIAI